MHCLMVVVCIISGMYAGGEIPVPHIPTILLVCCDHSTPDSSEMIHPVKVSHAMNLVVHQIHTMLCQLNIAKGKYIYQMCHSTQGL